MRAGPLALLALFAADMLAAEPYRPKLPMEIPVLVIKYFPVKPINLDEQVKHYQEYWKKVEKDQKVPKPK
jgi:hypothetical protein